MKEEVENGEVLHVVTSLDFGGVEKHLETYARYSSPSFWRPSFVAISGLGYAADKIQECGFEVFSLNLEPKVPSVKAIIQLWKLFRSRKPEVVHTHGAEANFNGIVAAWLARVPVVIGEEIGIPSHSYKAKVLFYFIYSLSDKVIAISDSVKDWLVESREAPEKKITRLYNPVEICPLPSSERKDGDLFKIGYIGRLEEVKNPLSLIRAVSILNNRGFPVRLVIVGDGSQFENCKSEVEALGVEGSVNLVGFQQQPLNYIKDCNLYVQPSFSEGFGIAVVEAMGCGIPVIATSVGGVPEIIQHGVNGWIIDDPSAENIAGQIIRVMDRKDELHRIGFFSRDSVVRRFSPNQYIEDLNKLYSDLFPLKS